MITFQLETTRIQFPLSLSAYLSLARSAQKRPISVAIVLNSHSICLSLTRLLNRRLARYRRAALCIASAGADVVAASRRIRAAKDRA